MDQITVHPSLRWGPKNRRHRQVPFGVTPSWILFQTVKWRSWWDHDAMRWHHLIIKRFWGPRAAPALSWESTVHTSSLSIGTLLRLYYGLQYQMYIFYWTHKYACLDTKCQNSLHILKPTVTAFNIFSALYYVNCKFSFSHWNIMKETLEVHRCISIV
jgi:hypothetical protein